MDFTSYVDIFGLILAIIAGGGMGSCVTMLYWRIPNNEPMTWQGGNRAHCTSCNVQLRTRDLFPVFNWIITRGKCFNCGAKINPIYFFVEFFTALTSIIAFAVYGTENLEAYFLSFYLGTMLVVLCTQAYTYNKIYDQTLILILFGALLVRSPENMVSIFQSIIALVLISYLVITQYNKRYEIKITSYGYIKLLAVACVWLEHQQLIILAISALILFAAIKVINSYISTAKPLPYCIAIALPWFALTIA